MRAQDCKSVQPGSTPGRASTYENKALRGLFCCPFRVPSGEVLAHHAFFPIESMALASKSSRRWA